MKKILVLLSKRDLAEIVVNWTSHHYGIISISRESFQKFQNAAWMNGTFSNYAFKKTIKLLQCKHLKNMGQNAAVFFAVLSVWQWNWHNLCEELDLLQPGFEPDLLHSRQILCHRVNPALEIVNFRRFSHFIE